jgi:hypothetical protein
MYYSTRISTAINGSSLLQRIVIIAVFSFLIYGSIYGLRKPFSAGTYGSIEPVSGINYKILLVTAQVAGYAFSKFLGITFISGSGFKNKGRSLIGIAVIAELALLGFSCTPAPWNVAWMFINGIPLGMGWGLVFGYLEGRRETDIWASILCVNFIVSSGFSKSVGRYLIERAGIAEQWMPFYAGLLFFPVLLISVWVLEHLKPPGPVDKAFGSERQAMCITDRKQVLREFGPGLVLLSSAYLVLTIIRDVRDNFSVEIWENLGYYSQPALFIQSEVPIAMVVLMLVGGLYWVKNHFVAFRLILLMSGMGAFLLVVATYLFHRGQVSPLVWMMASGSGLFLPYVLFNGTLFDRFIASFKVKGNVGFMMYISDTVGYFGSVIVLLWKNYGGQEISWLTFFINLGYWGAGVVLILTALSYLYFEKKRISQKESSYGRKKI